MDERRRRVLVVSEHAAPSVALIAAVASRAAKGPARFRLVVPNPARAELHLLHPERHEKAEEAEQVLRETMPALQDVADGPIIGSVSIRHDPMDVVEDVIAAEPVDEIMLCVTEHGFLRRIHQDLAHRLAHYGLPVVLVEESDA